MSTSLTPAPSGLSLCFDSAQAKRANRNPSKLIPTPIFSFTGLQRRVQIQEEEQASQDRVLRGGGEKSIVHQIARCEDRQQTLKTRIATLTQQHIALSSRILQVMHHHIMKEPARPTEVGARA